MPRQGGQGPDAGKDRCVPDPARTDGLLDEEWLRAFCERKYESDFSREMTRSVAEYLEDYRPEETGEG